MGLRLSPEGQTEQQQEELRSDSSAGLGIWAGNIRSVVREELSILKIGAGSHSGSVTLGKSLTPSEHQFAHL